MNRPLRLLGWIAAASILLCLALAAFTAFSGHSLTPISLIYNDGEWSASTGALGHGLGAVAGMAIGILAAVAALVLVPLILLVPLALVGLSLGGAIFLVVAVLAAVALWAASPLLLLLGAGWLLWRLCHPRAARPAASPVDPAVVP